MKRVTIHTIMNGSCGGNAADYKMACRIADGQRPATPQSGPTDLARRIDIRPGLTLFLVSLPPRDPFRIDFETNRVPLEFSYHVSGRVRYTVHHPGGKSVLTAQPRLGMVCAFPRSHGTMAFFDRDPIRMVAIHMSPRFCHSLIADQPELEDPVLQKFIQGAALRHLCRPSEMSPTMCLAAGQLLDCPYQGATRRLFYESKTLELMALQLSGGFKGSAAPPPVADRRERERIRTARNLLLRDLSNPPSLLEIAAAVGMSHTKLNKTFRAVYGTTVFDYLRLQRLEQSRLLLESAEMNIAEVAYATGFSSPSHFARAFLSRFGFQPSTYLKEVLGRRTICLG